MLWCFYHILFTFGFLLLLPKYLLRMRKRGGYRDGFAQRFGRYETGIAAKLADGRRRVWIHAVSVGETYVALGLMKTLRARDPDAAFILSLNTPTARAIAGSRLGAEDVLVYFPVDSPAFVNRALDALRPAALILVECELWPTLLRTCARRGIPMALVNGRVSDRSYRGYRRIRFLMRRLLPLFRVLCMQGEQDARRLAALGAPADRLRVLGSAKYEIGTEDPAAEDAAAADLERTCGSGRRVWLGASTWPGEEQALGELHMKLAAEFPGLLLVLAPRHAERAPEVCATLEAMGLTYVTRSGRRGASSVPTDRPAVFLLDTTGELKNFYALAEVVFVGKSLASHGGQNPIEPACRGRAVVCGPHMENFGPVMADFHAAGALVQVQDAVGLGRAVRELLSDEPLRDELGRRAHALVRRQSGALERTVGELAVAFAPRTSAAQADL